MNRILLLIVLGTATACSAESSPPASDECCVVEEETSAAEAVEPEVSPAATELLAKLEARGDEIDNYQAKVVYTRAQGLLGDEQTRVGRVWYEAGPPPKFAVVFTHLLLDRALRERPRSFVFDGVWLAEVHPDEKLFMRRQVVEPGETYDPLELGRGPFPLPIGQKQQQVLAVFTPAVIEPGEKDPEDSVHLHLEPRMDPQTGKPRSEFSEVDIWYDNKTLLPVKITTADESENTTLVKLSEAKVNEMDETQTGERFDTTPPGAGSGWRVEITPLENAQAE